MTLLVGSIFHMTRKIVSEMTYNVSMGTLNPTILYHLLILTAFMNSPAGRITVEKIGLRYITIANTTPIPHITYITNCQTPLPPPEHYIICGLYYVLSGILNPAHSLTDDFKQWARHIVQQATTVWFLDCLSASQTTA